MKKLTLLILLLLALSAAYTSNAQSTLQISFTVSDYNGVNVSCFGGNDGILTVNATGGTPPYSYQWSREDADTNATMTDLTASYYSVTVTDADNNSVTDGANLSEPKSIDPQLSTVKYNNGYNVSCFQCFNGSITLDVYGGITPYTFEWDDASTSQNRITIGSGPHLVVVTDANGCTAKANIFLTEPQGGWTILGNANTDTSQFIGSTDNADFVVKTNNAERIRVTGEGNLQIKSLAGDTMPQPLYADSAGNIQRASSGGDGIDAITPCRYLQSWHNGFYPNQVVLCNTLSVVGIGTINPIAKLHIESPGIDDNTSSLLARSAIGGGRRLFQIFDDGKIEVNQPNPISCQFNLTSTLDLGACFTTVGNNNTPFSVVGAFGSANNSGSGDIIGVRGAAIFPAATSIQNFIGVYGVSAQSGGPPPNSGFGLYGSALRGIPSLPYISIGVVGNGLDGISFNVGGEFNADALNYINYPNYSRGVEATAGDANVDNMGVLAMTYNSNLNLPLTGTDYALYATNLNPNTVSNQYWAAWINGKGYITNGPWQPSDTNFKQNIDTINNAMNIISQLTPRKYEFKTDEYPDMNFPTGLQYGFAAQEIENVLPNLVTDARKPEDLDSAGNVINPARTFKAYKEGSLIPIIVQALKEQQAIIDSLRNPNNNMRLRGDNNNSNPNQLDVVLATKNTIVLNQNVPNPFKEFTTISYFIPEKTNEAKIIFTDMAGIVIKEVDIKEKGEGQLNVYAQDLSSGIYTYTLVLDGISTDSKKMIRNK